MLTVKLVRGHSTKVVEAEEVNIYPAGPVSGCGIAPEPQDRDNSVREVAIKRGDQSAAFFIADSRAPRPQGWADTVQFYDAAYIENQNGATTEVVRPY